MKLHYKKFSELTLEELYYIISLRMKVFIVEQNCPYNECDGKDFNSIHIFAAENNEIISYARILLPGISSKEAAVGRVVVSKEYRGKGLAKEIMNKAIDYIKSELNETSVRIEAQVYLEEFYAKLGFKTVSNTFKLDNIPHIEMLLM